MHEYSPDRNTQSDSPFLGRAVMPHGSRETYRYLWEIHPLHSQWRWQGYQYRYYREPKEKMIPAHFPLTPEESSPEPLEHTFKIYEKRG